MTKTATKSMSLETAFEFQRAARALGVDADVQSHDGVEGNEVVKHYAVQLMLRDARTGNMSMERISGPEPVDLAALVARMRADISARATRTRRAIRVERQSEHS